uniref:PPE domain-containing protein n=1 Tax=Mycobacterium tuberculosis TaxID=1773 RepID=UPI001F47B17D|nr:PPE domain-containing protein [Mycobacterium tuberculosis]
MVDPVVVAANRSAFVQLVLSNVFGQNAPAIAAAQVEAADVADTQIQGQLGEALCSALCSGRRCVSRTA